MIEVGAKFEVVKGGTLFANGPVKLKKGEIWDIRTLRNPKGVLRVGHGRRPVLVVR